MISLVSRQRLRLDLLAVQSAVRAELASLVDERLSSGGDTVLHETPVFGGLFQRRIVSDDVDVSDWIFVQERQIAALGVSAGVHDHGRLESLIAVEVSQTRDGYLPLLA